MEPSPLLQTFIDQAIQQNASDIHLRVGQKPYLRVNGNLKTIGDSAITEADMDSVLANVASKTQLQKLADGEDIDLLYQYNGSAFRINAFHEQGGKGIVLRVLSPELPELSSLGLPPAINDMIHADKGLFLVTGATGSGKSTSLAAMLHELNKNKALHIVTIEDPIEYIHKPKQSLITQREVGSSTRGFADALRSALREDPDVIMVGELRDPETAKAALHAVETGHLVFATLHTGSAAQAADRLVNMFPATEHDPIRHVIAENMLGVLTQQLVERADGKGRVAAAELLINNTAIKNHIKTGKTHQIGSVIQTSKKDGMVTMKDSLDKLKAEGVISMATHAEAIKDYNRANGYDALPPRQ